MDKQEIEKLVDSKVVHLEKFIDEKVNAGIELRKQQVAKQFKIWSAAITAVFSFLLIIGFTKEELVSKVRETILPKSHIVKNLLENDSESQKLKTNIINELNDPTFKQYPGVKSSIESNVWEAISTTDKEKIASFLKNSNIDEEIINSYYSNVVGVLFSPEPCDELKRVKQILELGKEPQQVLIGKFPNTDNAQTNCSLPFRQNKKRVILYFPPSTRLDNGDNSLPWFQCPKNYPGLVVSLKIEDVQIDGVRVVGVERPTEPDGVEGVRARVTKKVAEEFNEKGISLGNHVSVGTISVTDVFE